MICTRVVIENYLVAIETIDCHSACIVDNGTGVGVQLWLHSWFLALKNVCLSWVSRFLDWCWALPLWPQYLPAVIITDSVQCHGGEDTWYHEDVNHRVFRLYLFRTWPYSQLQFFLLLFVFSMLPYRYLAQVLFQFLYHCTHLASDCPVGYFGALFPW